MLLLRLCFFIAEIQNNNVLSSSLEVRYQKTNFDCYLSKDNGLSLAKNMIEISNKELRLPRIIHTDRDVRFSQNLLLLCTIICLILTSVINVKLGLHKLHFECIFTDTISSIYYSYLYISSFSDMNNAHGR